MEELVSVVIPVYNVKKYIKKCVNTIINQTYKNLEIILVNDGSTDGSEKVCQELKNEDKRITVINQKNQGLSAARNTGIKYAKGQYIQFVDSDDWIDCNCIKELYNCIKKYKSDIAICGIIMSYPKYDKKMNWFDKNLCINNDDALIELLKNNNISSHAWNKLYKIELFDKIEFPIGKIYEDVRMMYKVFLKARKIAISNKYLYYYRQRSNSITTKIDINNKLEYIQAFKERYYYFESTYKKEKYTELALYSYLNSILSSLVTLKYPRNQLREHKEIINNEFKQLVKKSNYVIFKKYATKKEIVIFFIGVLFKNRLSYFFELNRIKKGR